MVLLDAYAAKRCPRRVHNEWDRTIPTAEWEVPAELQMRFDAGHDFEASVLERLRRALRPEQYVDLRDLESKRLRIAATLTAMDAGVEVVIGGWLPDDVEGSRKGCPDLLVRADSGYLPGEVKAHLMTKRGKRGRLRWSSLSDPAGVRESRGVGCRKSDRLDDYLQLAHYWRTLEACGHAGEEPHGLVIGTDELTELDGGGLVMVRLSLDEPSFSTYSRSRGKAMRTALERYDHEHDFRVRVAETAALRQGVAEDPAPLVRPIFIEECKTCPWFEHCLEVAGAQSPGAESMSARLIGNSFSRREWLALEKAGCTSLEELAGLDTTDPGFREAYLPEVTHQTSADERLAAMVRRARMVLAGVGIERTTTGPIAVPRAAVEIDFDTEWDPDNRVYLWGARVCRHGAEPVYQPVVSWDRLDEQRERALAAEFVGRLRALLEEAGGKVLVYHYSPAEVHQLRRVLGAEEVADVLAHFVDLHQIVRQHYFGVEGLGIKHVAPQFGFAWRDESPSGLQSQLWLQQARDTSDSAAAGRARSRLLDYNEDDVAATAALREGLALA